jgi:hypothetical protein
LQHPDETLENVRLKHLKHLKHDIAGDHDLPSGELREPPSSMDCRGLSGDRLGGCGEGLDGRGGALGIGLRDGAVALGEDVGRRERLHKAAHHGAAHALRRRQILSDGSSTSTPLAVTAAVGAASADPSGLVG